MPQAKPEVPAIEPVTEPQTPEDYIRRGWVFHVQGEHVQAEHDFRTVISMERLTVEGYYGLGLSLKLQRRYDMAVQAFQKALDLLEGNALSQDPARAVMLHHLADWHIMTIQHS
jgi:tetratricopeptide (TPR) repeat protein